MTLERELRGFAFFLEPRKKSLERCKECGAQEVEMKEFCDSPVWVSHIIQHEII